MAQINARFWQLYHMIGLIILAGNPRTVFDQSTPQQNFAKLFELKKLKVKLLWNKKGGQTWLKSQPVKNQKLRTPVERIFAKTFTFYVPR